MTLWIAALEYNASNLQELSKIWFLVFFFAEKSTETSLGVSVWGLSMHPSSCWVLSVAVKSRSLQAYRCEENV